VKVSWLRWAIPAAVVPVLMLLAYGFRTDPKEIPSPLLGRPAAAFSLTTFAGTPVSLESLRGKVVVLNFWASWCKPCEQEAAEMQQAWEANEASGEVIFLGADYVDTEPEALAYLKKFEIDFYNGPDMGTKISQLFRMKGVPETYFIDREGVLQYVKVGPFASADEIQIHIDELLK
jgi:cytochrome c biogenesis protein CcmG/thiol:disulfide interchange protein DsbE